MSEQTHHFEKPQVSEIVPQWRRETVKQPLGYLSLMQSLPDNVFVLRPDTSDHPPQAA